jgi:hypothetical protein
MDTTFHTNGKLQALLMVSMEMSSHANRKLQTSLMVSVDVTVHPILTESGEMLDSRLAVVPCV